MKIVNVMLATVCFLVVAGMASAYDPVSAARTSIAIALAGQAPAVLPLPVPDPRDKEIAELREKVDQLTAKLETMTALTAKSKSCGCSGPGDCVCAPEPCVCAKCEAPVWPGPHFPLTSRVQAQKEANRTGKTYQTYDGGKTWVIERAAVPVSYEVYQFSGSSTGGCSTGSCRGR